MLQPAGRGWGGEEAAPACALGLGGLLKWATKGWGASAGTLTALAKIGKEAPTPEEVFLFIPLQCGVGAVSRGAQPLRKELQVEVLRLVPSEGWRQQVANVPSPADLTPGDCQSSHRRSFPEGLFLQLLLLTHSHFPSPSPKDIPSSSAQMRILSLPCSWSRQCPKPGLWLAAPTFHYPNSIEALLAHGSSPTGKRDWLFSQSFHTALPHVQHFTPICYPASFILVFFILLIFTACSLSLLTQARSPLVFF